MLIFSLAVIVWCGAWVVVVYLLGERVLTLWYVFHWPFSFVLKKVLFGHGKLTYVVATTIVVGSFSGMLLSIMMHFRPRKNCDGA